MQPSPYKENSKREDKTWDLLLRKLKIKTGKNKNPLAVKTTQSRVCLGENGWEILGLK